MEALRITVDSKRAFDLGQEVAYSTAPTNAKPSLMQQGEAQANLSSLEEKVESMERTLNRVLAMMRKLLHAVGETQPKPSKRHD